MKRKCLCISCFPLCRLASILHSWGVARWCPQPWRQAGGSGRGDDQLGAEGRPRPVPHQRRPAAGDPGGAQHPQAGDGGAPGMGKNDSPWGPSGPRGEVAEVRQVRGESAASRSVVPVPRRTRHLRGVRGQCWGRIHLRMFTVLICYCVFAVYRLMFVHSARRVSAVGPAVWRPTWGTCLLPTNNLIKLIANLC